MLGQCSYFVHYGGLSSQWKWAFGTLKCVVLGSYSGHLSGSRSALYLLECIYSTGSIVHLLLAFAHFDIAILTLNLAKITNMALDLAKISNYDPNLAPSCPLTPRPLLGHILIGCGQCSLQQPSTFNDLCWLAGGNS